uniref:Uncharacterized protein n=1 Tax=Oryza brachyantha TaxID=4533 RepID=J3MT97_ORYBR
MRASSSTEGKHARALVRAAVCGCLPGGGWLDATGRRVWPRFRSQSRGMVPGLEEVPRDLPFLPACLLAADDYSPHSHLLCGGLLFSVESVLGLGSRHTKGT